MDQLLGSIQVLKRLMTLRRFSLPMTLFANPIRSRSAWFAFVVWLDDEAATDASFCASVWTTRCYNRSRSFFLGTSEL